LGELHNTVDHTMCVSRRSKGDRWMMRRQPVDDPRIVGCGAWHHAVGMFVVTEAEAAAIRAAFDRGGELSAAVELRRLFPGVTDYTQARACARTIAGWKPLPSPGRTKLHPGKRR
jgi:hypothetical protein